MVEYRIEFTLQSRGEGEESFIDVGFGSSGTCGSPDEAAFAVESIVQNQEWDTTRGMPSPATIATGTGDDSGSER